MNFSFDVSLGREVEFHNRVNDNDPANSALILAVLAASGLEDDSVLRTYATLSALLGGASNEATNTNYARKTLADADIVAPTINTTTHKVSVTFSNQTFTTILAGDSWRKLLLCIDMDTTAGTDANIIPVCAFDLLSEGVAVTPNGNNIIVAAPNGYLISS